MSASDDLYSPMGSEPEDDGLIPIYDVIPDHGTDAYWPTDVLIRNRTGDEYQVIVPGHGNNAKVRPI